MIDEALDARSPLVHRWDDSGSGGDDLGRVDEQKRSGSCASIDLVVEQWESEMQNVNMKIEGNTLTIEVNLDERIRSSSTGKTIIVATSDGNEKLPAPYAHIGFSLSVYTKQGVGK